MGDVSANDVIDESRQARCHRSSVSHSGPNSLWHRLSSSCCAVTLGCGKVTAQSCRAYDVELLECEGSGNSLDAIAARRDTCRCLCKTVDAYYLTMPPVTLLVAPSSCAAKCYRWPPGRPERWKGPLQSTAHFPCHVLPSRGSYSCLWLFVLVDPAAPVPVNSRNIILLFIQCQAPVRFLTYIPTLCAGVYLT